jgi:hypothetical protein
VIWNGLPPGSSSKMKSDISIGLKGYHAISLLLFWGTKVFKYLKDTKMGIE